MKQTGTFYTLTNNENSTEVKKPFPNIFLYFSQGGVRKLTTQTNTDGKFDFDLPLGNYNVTMSIGANSTVHTLAGGSEFSLTSSSKVNAFEQWAMTPVYLKPEENPLVIRLAELAKIATDAATEAKMIQDAMNNGSTGTGKWVKESLIANMMNVGDFGVGNIRIIRDRDLSNVLSYSDSLGFETMYASSFNKPAQIRRDGILVKNMAYDNAYGYELYYENGGKIFFRYTSNSIMSEFGEILTTFGTTVDANGNIKAASPIIKLFNDHIEHNESFKEKPTFEKLGTGVYKITNTPGLSKNGWTHNIPLNSNGRGYFRVRVEHLEDGCIVRVFRVKNVLNPDTFEIDVVDGDPIDIGKDQRWIDLRFHEEPQEADDEELLTQLDNLDESAH